MSEHSLRSWSWQKVMQVLRLYAQDIALLAKNGEQISKDLIERYRYAYDHPTDLAANNSLRDAFEYWMRMNLTASQRIEMASKYGYMVDEKKPN